MSQKSPYHCPIDGTQYAPGTVADLVHRYLTVEADRELEVLDELLSKPEWIFEWQSSIVRELAMHFQNYASTSPEPGYEQPAFKSWMRKWNLLGQLVGRQQPDLAEHLYQSLLSSLREAQSRWGWLPKGLAYHQIGWSKIITGRSEEIHAAEHYFAVAMIEDILHDLISEGKAGKYVLNPAYRVLSSLYQKGKPFFAEVVDFTTQAYRTRSRWPEDLFVKNAELILFEHLMNGMRRPDAS